MKWTALIAASAISLAIGPTAGVAASAKRVVEKSPDLLRPQQIRKIAARPSALPLLSAELIAAAAAPTVEDVGDPDSFGRNVTYLGLAQTQGVTLISDCTGTDPTLERCVLTNPAPTPTSFNESDLALMNLPAKASKSLLCFTLTPIVQLNWQNTLVTPAMARFSANALITIENEVLNDPTLIDPNTGLPFGGQITLGLSTFSDSHTLQPNEVDNKLLFMTRACIAGVVNKRALVDNYGLSETQAKDFFKKAMTIHFGARGTVALTEFASYFYGIRLYGD